MNLRRIGLLLLLIGLTMLLSQQKIPIFKAHIWAPAPFISIGLAEKDSNTFLMNEQLEVNVHFCLPTSCKNTTYFDPVDENCSIFFDFNNITAQTVKIFVEEPSGYQRYIREFNINDRCFTRMLNFGTLDTSGDWSVIVRVVAVDKNGEKVYFESRKGIEVLSSSRAEEIELQRKTFIINLISGLISAVGLLLYLFPESLEQIVKKGRSKKMFKRRKH